MNEARFKAQVTALIVQSLLRPRAAAEVLMGLRLPGSALWTALGLMAVLNAIVYALSLQVTGAADPTEAMMPPVFHAPLVFALFLFVTLVLTVLSLFWVGRKFGGGARIEDLLVLITWIQVLRLMLQLAVAVLVLVAPALAAVVIVVSSVWGLYILVGFVAAAQGWRGNVMALVVIVLAFLLMAVGLTVVFAATGLVAMGDA